MPRSLPLLEDLLKGVLSRHPTMLGRAITLLESSRDADKRLGEALLSELSKLSRKPALRIGVTGVPGVGKSTFIDAFGTYLVKEKGLKVAVLAVDPSSKRSGGSILGDKTRMAELSSLKEAFVRPSPSSGTLGGVTRRAHGIVSLFERVGFDVIFVETVGVGQSETAVKELCDTFLFLSLAHAGDELQGMKRGVMEMADILVVHKADGDYVDAAKRAASQLRMAVHLLFPEARHEPDKYWLPPVKCLSSIEKTGQEEMWQTLLAHRAFLDKGGRLEKRRASQRYAQFEMLLLEHLEGLMRKKVDALSIEEKVRKGELSPELALERVLQGIFEAEGNA